MACTWRRGTLPITARRTARSAEVTEDQSIAVGARPILVVLRTPEVPPTDRHAITIRPSAGWAGVDIGELWAYRELFVFLTWRDIKVRYKQTALGASWAVLQPLATMAVFSLFFGQLAGIPSGDVPYPLFSYAALVPWTFFATAVAVASTSLVDHEQLVTKIYFPRLIMPAAAVLACLIDLAIAFVVLIGLMLAYGVSPTLAIFAVPLFVALAVMTAVRCGSRR